MNNNKPKINGGKKSQAWDFDYISCPQETIFDKLKTSPKGLTEQEAKRRCQHQSLGFRLGKSGSARDDAIHIEQQP